MKVAVVYNRESERVINLLSIPNKEKYGKKTIKMIVDGLKKGGHQVAAFEADKMLIPHLEEFMPGVVKGERPGMVFNVAYGIQGQARYTHVPGILEMVGIPYTGSGPMAHSLALDKVVAKMVFVQRGVATPNFAVLDSPETPLPDMPFPLIVKPKDEAVSFGLRIVNNEDELREGAKVIFDEFGQAVLVEEYIDGREVNVALLGNDPPETLPPVELVFGPGQRIYTMEDKKHKSGRKVEQVCPAELEPELLARVNELAVGAFRALGCRDSARVDMRIDKDGKPWVLEINSLASLGPGGSLVAAAKTIGMDYPAVVNRLVDIASARYFGTPSPQQLSVSKGGDRKQVAFSFLTQRRDDLEKRLQQWCMQSSRTSDSVGNRQVAREVGKVMTELAMELDEQHSDSRSTWLWKTKRGFANGTLLVAHIDVPLPADSHKPGFKKDPEYLYGDGVGSSRAPMAMLEYVMRALRAQKLLHRIPLGVLFYADEGRDARYSESGIVRAAKQCAQGIVLRPQLVDGQIVTQRRGHAKFELTCSSTPSRFGGANKEMDSFRWLAAKTVELTSLTSTAKKIAVAVSNVRADALPAYLPHRARATVWVSYRDAKSLETTTEQINAILGNGGSKTVAWQLEEVSNRPPLKETKAVLGLADKISAIGKDFEIPVTTGASLLPSVAGLFPADVPVVCGMGPTVEDINTVHERIRRMSFIRQTLLLTQFLLKQVEE